MNEYWEAPLTEDEPAEEPFEESGRPGCLAVFAVLLAVIGIGYSVTFGILGVDLIVNQPGRVATGAIVTLCAIAGLPVALILSIGLWRMQTWAWWAAVILQALGLGLAFLSFGAAFLNPDRAVGFVLGPLMGLFVGGVVLAWFVRYRELFGQGDTAQVDGRQVEEPDLDDALVTFAITVIGCTTLFGLVSFVLVVTLYLFGFSFTGFLRALGLPLP